MKKFISAVLITALLTVPVYASPSEDLVNSYLNNINAPYLFSDMEDTAWAAKSVEFLTSMGIVNGFEDGTFRPDSNITKAEFVKIIVSAFGLYNPDAAVTLKDNLPGDWYYIYVSSALEKEIAVTDKKGMFNSGDYITREEMFEISKKAMDYAEISLTLTGNPIEFTDKEDINPEYQESIDYMSANGIVAGNPDGSLLPKAGSTRAEACVMLTRMLDSALSNEKAKFNSLTNTDIAEVEDE